MPDGFLTRRRLLATATAALATSGFQKANALTPAGPLQSSEKRRISIAVKLHMVQEKLSIGEKFQLLKDLGFDGVEVSIRDRNLVPEITRATHASDLPVHGVVNSSAPDISTAIRMASDIGADSVLIVAEQNANRYYDQNFGHWRNQLNAALPLAEKHNVRLLIENVRATFLKKAEEMARFLDSIDSPMKGAYFDTGNTITWTKQSAEHWARVLGQRISKIDVKDRGHANFGDPKLASATAIGTDGGEVHWKNVRAELKRVNFSGWATAEVRGGDRKRLQQIAEWMRVVLRTE